MKIKHSKFKNTGLIFELLVRKLTSDTLSQKNSPAIKIIKEFYTKTELSKEYKIYQSLLKILKICTYFLNVFVYIA